MGQKPSVGRVVHYVSYGTPGGEYGKECRAAIITEVSPESKGEGQEIVSLAVLNPTGMFFNQGCVHSELENHGGTWHWPESIDGWPRESKTFNEFRADQGLPPIGIES